jgi:hypothetical protein
MDAEFCWLPSVNSRLYNVGREQRQHQNTAKKSAVDFSAAANSLPLSARDR